MVVCLSRKGVLDSVTGETFFQSVFHPVESQLVCCLFVCHRVPSFFPSSFFARDIKSFFDEPATFLHKAFILRRRNNNSVTKVYYVVFVVVKHCQPMKKRQKCVICEL